MLKTAVLLNFADSIARVGQLVRSGVQQKQGAKGLFLWCARLTPFNQEPGGDQATELEDRGMRLATWMSGKTCQ
jgi:hypothetical protein